MGLFYPKPYKVFRNGEWVLITPEPQQYKTDPLKAVEITKNGIFRKLKNKFKRKNK